MVKRIFFVASLAALGITAFTAVTEFSSLPKGKKFLDPANIDQTVNPADDFYAWANGAWLKKTPIPASETRWGSFNLL